MCHTQCPERCLHRQTPPKRSGYPSAAQLALPPHRLTGGTNFGQAFSPVCAGRGDLSAADSEVCSAGYVCACSGFGRSQTPLVLFLASQCAGAAVFGCAPAPGGCPGASVSVIFAQGRSLSRPRCVLCCRVCDWCLGTVACVGVLTFIVCVCASVGFLLKFLLAFIFLTIACLCDTPRVYGMEHHGWNCVQRMRGLRV